MRNAGWIRTRDSASTTSRTVVRAAFSEPLGRVMPRFAETPVSASSLFGVESFRDADRAAYSCRPARKVHCPT